MKTLETVLNENKGIGKGFDFLRIFLASMVVFNHSFLTVEGDFHTIEKYRLWSFFGAVLPMFFALSGFLISGSAQRLKLKDFLLNRGIRIVPALAVDILVSAVIIGTIFTTVPLHEYFTDKKFAHYFLNIIGFIHLQLAGVFLTNPLPDQMNASLWTVPYEIGCYMLMSGLIIFGAVKSSRKIIYAVGGFTAFYLAMAYLFNQQTPFTDNTPVDNYLNNFVTRGNYLYLYFLSGTLFYVLRAKIPYSLPLALASAAIIFVDGLRLYPLGMWNPLVLTLPVGYLTAYVGLLPIKKIPFYSGGDYSYGIYLYAFPFQQMLVNLFPQMGIIVNFISTMVLVTGVAYISWHYIEKPILGLRKKFSFTARKTEVTAASVLPQPKTEDVVESTSAQPAMQAATPQAV